MNTTLKPCKYCKMSPRVYVDGNEGYLQVGVYCPTCFRQSPSSIAVTNEDIPPAREQAIQDWNVTCGEY